MDIQFWSKPIYYIVYLQAMLYQKSERQDPGHLGGNRGTKPGSAKYSSWTWCHRKYILPQKIGPRLLFIGK